MSAKTVYGDEARPHVPTGRAVSFVTVTAKTPEAFCNSQAGSPRLQDMWISETGGTFFGSFLGEGGGFYSTWGTWTPKP